MPGNDGVPDPVLQFPIRYVLLNLSSAPVKLNVTPACPSDDMLPKKALVFVLSTLATVTVINPPLIVNDVFVPVPKSIALFWKPYT